MEEDSGGGTAGTVDDALGLRAGHDRSDCLRDVSVGAGTETREGVDSPANAGARSGFPPGHHQGTATARFLLSVPVGSGEPPRPRRDDSVVVHRHQHSRLGRPRRLTGREGTRMVRARRGPSHAPSHRGSGQVEPGDHDQEPCLSHRPDRRCYDAGRPTSVLRWLGCRRLQRGERRSSLGR